MRKRIVKGILKTAAAAVAAAAVFSSAVSAAIAALPLLVLIPGIIVGVPLLFLAFVSACKGLFRLLDGPKKEKFGRLPLKEGEIAFTQSIFGRKISKGALKRIRKGYVADYDDEMAGSTSPSSSQINFYGSKYHSADYSSFKNAFNYGTFIHEMTHKWQDQRLSDIFHMMADRVRGRHKKYKYTLSLKSRFRKFGLEQQAAIIEDYALYFLHPTAPSRWISNTRENNELLKMVVEKKFPAARGTRLRLEAQRVHP